MAIPFGWGGDEPGEINLVYAEEEHVAQGLTIKTLEEAFKKPFDTRSKLNPSIIQDMFFTEYFSPNTLVENSPKE